MSDDIHGSLNVPIEHHPTIRYMVYNGYYKVMSNSPKMGHLPIPDIIPHNFPIKKKRLLLEGHQEIRVLGLPRDVQRTAALAKRWKIWENVTNRSKHGGKCAKMWEKRCEHVGQWWTCWEKMMGTWGDCAVACWLCRCRWTSCRYLSVLADFQSHPEVQACEEIRAKDRTRRVQTQYIQFHAVSSNMLLENPLI